MQLRHKTQLHNKNERYIYSVSTSKPQEPSEAKNAHGHKGMEQRGEGQTREGGKGGGSEDTNVKAQEGKEEERKEEGRSEQESAGPGRFQACICFFM